MRRLFSRVVLVGLALVAAAPARAAAPERGKTEVLRDSWGIPHVFAESDAGAMYGLGFATAEDRAFQMVYSLRIIQGRLAEVAGEVKHLSRRETSLDNDKKMRTFGFYRAAGRTAANLDPETRALLQAYSDGVNDYFTRHRDRLHPLFARLNVVVEPWTPADCLASWWHLGQFFATDGTRELIARRNEVEGGAAGRGRPGRGPSLLAPPGLTPMPPDDAPAVVQRADLSPDWVGRVNAFAREHGMAPAAGAGEGPKFSHAWVVGGKRTTTGSAVLMSDPQTQVRNPSLFYEFHVVGKTFNARGIGVPGSPAILIGFTDRVAWGVTALGADQADLFLLETDAAHPDQYRFDGEWRKMEIHRERIAVRGGAPVEYVVRETHLGPVATEFCFAQPGEGEVALKRIPMCETERETIQAAFAMVRAKNAKEFAAALPGWRFPSANLVYGDTAGDIGYQAIAAIPIRSARAPDAGRAAQNASGAADDWQGMVPCDLLPRVENPKQGYLGTANHRAIGSWYPIPLGAMTGAGGDTVRSWRLRERLEAKERFRPEDVLDIHYDSVNPARREIVGVGLHLRDVLKRPLSPDAASALDYLDDWFRAGASSELTHPGAELAAELNTFFRFVSTDLAFVYSGGEGGLSYFLKTVAARLDKDPKADVSAPEQQFIEGSLSAAWRQAREKYGEEAARWPERARAAVAQQRLGYGVSLDGFPSPDPSLDLSVPALRVVDGGTIRSQGAQSYTQFVPMHDPDAAMTLLPIGQSEHPESASRTSTLKLWEEGKLHPAPLSRAAVERIAASRVTLAP